jgi:hypothetical protein
MMGLNMSDIIKCLSSNRNLYDYLQFLSLKLEQRGATSLYEAITFACAQASSSSTEFIGESRIALRRVLNEEKGVLTDQERTDLLGILKQIDKALDER